MDQREPTRRDAIIEVIGTAVLIGSVSGFGPLGTVLYKLDPRLEYLPVSIVASVVAALGTAAVMLVLDARGPRRIFGGRSRNDDVDD